MGLTADDLQADIAPLAAKGYKIRWNGGEIVVIGLPDGQEETGSRQPVPRGDREEGRGGGDGQGQSQGS